MLSPELQVMGLLHTTRGCADASKALGSLAGLLGSC